MTKKKSWWKDLEIEIVGCVIIGLIFVIALLAMGIEKQEDYTCVIEETRLYTNVACEIDNEYRLEPIDCDCDVTSCLIEGLDCKSYCLDDYYREGGRKYECIDKLQITEDWCLIGKKGIGCRGTIIQECSSYRHVLTREECEIKKDYDINKILESCEVINSTYVCTINWDVLEQKLVCGDETYDLEELI